MPTHKKSELAALNEKKLAARNEKKLAACNENKLAAHFLLVPHLELSPPNDAISRAYSALGYDVEHFAPDSPNSQVNSIDYSHLSSVAYGYRWLLLNALHPRWARYDAFSCTSEDPIAIAGVLAFIWRKPLIFLSDEIKTKSYAGNRSARWKKLCRWAMRRAALTIVNDEARVDLQKEYADLSQDQAITVYPGCFLQPPKADDKITLRRLWEVQADQYVLGFSGGCNLTSGVDWALESLDKYQQLAFITQPLAFDGMSKYLLQNHRHAQRIYVQDTFMSWQESWSSMGGVDIGVAIYNNPSEQFQLMGISSNRLCMFLAMGVPVIVNKQASFQFVEDYHCGIMVESSEQFSAALGVILSDLTTMQANALKCAREYIDTQGKYQNLLNEFALALDVTIPLSNTHDDMNTSADD